METKVDVRVSDEEWEEFKNNVQSKGMKIYPVMSELLRLYNKMCKRDITIGELSKIVDEQHLYI